MNAVRPDAAGVRDPARAGARRTLRFLADLSQSLAVSLDLKTTLEPALARIMDFMRAEAASLFLLDPATQLLECRICAGPVDVVGLKLEAGQGVVGRAVTENAPQRSDDARRDARVNLRVDAETGFVTRAILCVPLATAQGPIGALEIINRRDGGAFDEDDAEVLRLIAAPMALAINNARLAMEVAEQQRIRREMTLARSVQKSLLPKRRRGRFPLIGVNLPAHEISGDFYDYFDLADGRLAFFIGDISGKGLDAAFLMVRVAGLLRFSGHPGPAPAAWLCGVNAELCKTLQHGRFVCAVVGIYDRATRTAVIANAGFPPALLDRGDAPAGGGRGRFEELAADGPPLGILAEAEYGERTIDLGAAALYLFSDGATDVRDGARARLGAAGLRELIRRCAPLAPEPRLRAIVGELKRRRLVDDTTLLLLQEPRGCEARELLALEFAADPCQMRRVRAALRTALDAEEVAPELRDRLVLAVDEACTNIMRHAYCGGAGTIALRLTREHDTLGFELRDAAPAVDPARVRPRDLSECRAGGLGVAFIDATMDCWRVEGLPGGQGNRLVMRKRIARKTEDAG